MDLKNMSMAELADLERQAKQLRLEKSLRDREAYEGIRAEFVRSIETKVTNVTEEV